MNRKDFSRDYGGRTEPHETGDPKDRPSDPYNALPVAIRMVISPKEYAWLSDARKATIERDELEPDF